MNEEQFKRLKIVSVDSQNAWCYCIFHKDTDRPNFTISLNPTYLGRYKCWACNRDGMLTNKQIACLDLTPYNAYDLSKTQSAQMMTRWTLYIKDCYRNLERYPLLKLGLAKQLQVSQRSLEHFNIGWNGAAYTIPMMTFSGNYRDGGLCGAIRRFPDGTKKAVYGSNLGWISPQLFDFDYDEEVIYLCEGFSDALILHDLGFTALGRPNCHFVKDIDYLLDKFSGVGPLIVIIPDNDEVGKAGAHKLHDKIPTNMESRIFEFKGAKDIREYVLKNGRQEVKQELERFSC